MKILNKILNAKPVPYTSSLILNILGAQFLMTFLYHILHILKGKRIVSATYAGYVATLEKEGVVCIPNFLPAEEHAQVQEAYEHLLPRFTEAIPYANSSNLLPHVERLPLSDVAVPETVRSLFLDHPLIREVAQSFLRRKKFSDIRAYFTRVSIRSQEEINSPQNGGTNNVHIDAPLRILKFFYLVDKANEANGTLHYARTSQRRNTFSRLFYEYLLSIRYALNKRHPHATGEYDKGKPWVTIGDEDIKRFGFSMEPIEGAANTLIIANVGGFHRRGNFSVPGERRTVEISFRNEYILSNYFNSFWS